MPDVYVGLGSNIERERNVRDGLGALRARFGDLWRSSIYEVPAEGFVGDNFFNLVVGFRSCETVEVVAGALRDIEEAHGVSLLRHGVLPG